MKAVFAHDHRFYYEDNQYFTDGFLNEDTFQRYTNLFDEVNIIARVIQNNKKEVQIHQIKDDKIRICKSDLFKVYDRNMDRVIAESDIVIARLPSFIGNRAVHYAKKHKKTYVIESVACPFEAYWYHGTLGKVVAPYMEMHTKKLVKDSPYVSYVTKEYLQKRYPTKGINTSCSDVALLDFDDAILNKRRVHIDQKAGEKCILGTAAAVHVKFKGQQYVIEALGRLKEQGFTNYEYQLVGRGDQSYLRSVAKKYGVSDQVKFLGSIPHEKVFEWLDEIDIYAQPSRQEGLPRALIEAMSRALPAFGATTAGIPELLEEKYLFSNTKNNIEEIIGILKGYTPDVMKEQGESNYYESKKYQKGIVEKRRQDFFKEMICAVENS